MEANQEIQLLRQRNDELVIREGTSTKPYSLRNKDTLDNISSLFCNHIGSSLRMSRNLHRDDREVYNAYILGSINLPELFRAVKNEVQPSNLTFNFESTTPFLSFGSIESDPVASSPKSELRK
jgi:hypothetical protein